jgi:protocatechuate 3,4-dioxygenase beta subunit
LISAKTGYRDYYNALQDDFMDESKRAGRIDMQYKHSLLIIIGLCLTGMFPFPAAADYECPPTRPDMLGPFYEPDAPLRTSVGKGYLMTGTLKSARDCTPIAGAAIEIWLTNPRGQYDDQHRATVIANDAGAYRFESNRPTNYGFRPPHVHLRITAEGYEPLVTQHYPAEGADHARFDIVLIPARPQ